ncbi:hypothetical protein AMAG_14377 [Allomyces macrogynus ATCC 38327]|uniref:Uncharacterized protein n=1 Tax=Allomyces macrogynus (strain ATCC 38327) TaxID=578462 RepID=A0A0L0T5J5_ALLM3|nr:hypothetical protein AMAG_14377 [Allomyces macrogynus ATCC 38327]|eukprot:KNE69849.1 hypothetical protein AMAG_14377 [Allomyces macrogynus ATCC 38327]
MTRSSTDPSPSSSPQPDAAPAPSAPESEPAPSTVKDPSTSTSPDNDQKSDPARDHPTAINPSYDVPPPPYTAATATAPAPRPTPPAAARSSVADLMVRFAAWAFPKLVTPPEEVVILGDADAPFGALMVVLDTVLRPAKFEQQGLGREIEFHRATSDQWDVRVFSQTEGVLEKVAKGALASATHVVYLLDAQRNAAAPIIPPLLADISQPVQYLCLHSLLRAETVDPTRFVPASTHVSLVDGRDDAAIARFWSSLAESAREQRRQALVAKVAAQRAARGE